MKAPSDETASASASAIPAGQFQYLSRGKLVRWVNNPRQSFDESELVELEQSIDRHGFLPCWPLLVRPMKNARVREETGELRTELMEQLKTMSPLGGVYEALRKRLTLVELKAIFETLSEKMGDAMLRADLSCEIGLREGKAPEVFPRYCLEQLTKGGNWREVNIVTDATEAANWLADAQKFEIIDGERRDRIAEKRGLGELPCVVRPMDDTEALEIALVSTLQKKGLNPMEEALSFQRLDGLLATQDPASTAQQRREEMAGKIGRSPDYVRDRLSLCRLKGEAAGDAVKAGKLPAEHGRLIARLPSAELRQALTGKVMNRALYGERCMPIETLREELKKYQRELRGARFDPKDATLVPERKDASGQRIAGGACSDCPFNTKHADSDSPGSKMHCCLNTSCYDEKIEAEHEQWRHAATEGDVSALSFDDNADLWDTDGKRLAPHSPYVELDDVPASHEVKSDVAIDKAKHTWRKLIKGRGVPTVLGRDESGKIHELARHELAKQAAQENKHRIFRSDETPSETRQRQAPAPSIDPDAVPSVERAAAAQKRDEEAAEERFKAELKEEEDATVFDAEVGALVRSIEGRPDLPKGFFAALWEILCDICVDGQSCAAHRRGIDPLSGKVDKAIRDGSNSQAAGWLVECLIQQGAWENGTTDTLLLDRLAKLYQTDLKGAKRLALDQLKATRKAEAEQKEIAAGMVWKSKRLPTDPYAAFNHHGVAENPDVCELIFPKSSKITAHVAIAQISNTEGVMGFTVMTPKSGYAGPCERTGTKYGTRNASLRAGLLGIKQELTKAKVDAAIMARVDAWLGMIGEPDKPKPAAKPKKAKAKKGARK